jgi:hypothetical protein
MFCGDFDGFQELPLRFHLLAVHSVYARRPNGQQFINSTDGVSVPGESVSFEQLVSRPVRLSILIRPMNRNFWLARQSPAMSDQSWDFHILSKALRVPCSIFMPITLIQFDGRCMVRAGLQLAGDA